MRSRAPFVLTGATGDRQDRASRWSSRSALGAEVVCADSRQLYRGPRRRHRQADAARSARAYRTTASTRSTPGEPLVAPAGTRARRGRVLERSSPRPGRPRCSSAAPGSTCARSTPASPRCRARSRTTCARACAARLEPTAPTALHARARRARSADSRPGSAARTGSGSRARSRSSSPPGGRSPAWQRRRSARPGAVVLGRARRPRAELTRGARRARARRSSTHGLVEEVAGACSRAASRREAPGLRRARLPRGDRRALEGHAHARRRERDADAPHAPAREAPGDVVPRRGAARRDRASARSAARVPGAGGARTGASATAKAAHGAAP